MPARIRPFQFVLISALLLFIATPWTYADTIRSNQIGTTISVQGYWGQSVVTGTGGPWNNLVFNFSSSSGPLAFGNLFLLTDQYLGNPTALSMSTSGYLGKAASSGGYYMFDPTVSIAANTKYYFYTDQMGSQLMGRASSGVPGENHYFAFDGWNYGGPYLGVNFSLQGTPIQAPEPATLTLLGFGFTAFGLARRRLAKRQAFAPSGKRAIPPGCPSSS